MTPQNTVFVEISQCEIQFDFVGMIMPNVQEARKPANYYSLITTKDSRTDRHSRTDRYSRRILPIGDFISSIELPNVDSLHWVCSRSPNRTCIPNTKKAPRQKACLRVSYQRQRGTSSAQSSTLTTTSHSKNPLCSRMCKTQGWKSLVCNHRWLTITSPCGPERGFDNCCYLVGEKTALGCVSWFPATVSTCPVCAMKEQYDGNKVRMVMGTRKGAFGYDPSFYDDGGRCEGGAVCCVIQ